MAKVVVTIGDNNLVAENLTPEQVKEVKQHLPKGATIKVTKD